MKQQPHISEALIREIGRYLAVVEVFRSERCEPTWLPELAPSGNPSAWSVAVSHLPLGSDARPN
jgi:hypothetical protein